MIKIYQPSGSFLSTFLDISVDKLLSAKNAEAKLVKSGNLTIESVLQVQRSASSYEIGYILGLIMANYDTVPKELKTSFIINEMPANQWVKSRINELVLERMGTVYYSLISDYFQKYKDLTALLSKNENQFSSYFSNGTHNVVSGFASGYSHAWHLACDEIGFKTSITDPIMQDIWKNWQFFIYKDNCQYQLSGLYILKNGSTAILNERVYDVLKNRNCEFTEYPVDIALQ